MDDTTTLSAIALGTGVAFLLAAAVAVLLRRTQGVPPARRLRLIASLARSAVASSLPSRWIVVSAAAGVFAFLGSLLAGLVVAILIVRAIPRAIPCPH